MTLKLNNSVGHWFATFIFTGFVVILLTVLVTMVGGSPFQYGRAGMGWMLVHFASGLAMVYAGMFGLMTYNVTEVTASNFKMSVVWTAFGVVAGIYIFALALCVSGLLPVTTPPTGADITVARTGSIVAILAFLVYVQACRYFMRLHRLLRPYKDLVG